MTVRRAVGGDAHALAALNRFVHETHLARRPDYFKPVRADEAAAWFRERLEERTTAAWIAEAEGRPVGYVLTFFDQIAVDPVWRRRGVGRALMAAALAEAGSRGMQNIELFSWAFNTDAHAMFQRLGFEPRMLRFERRAP